MKTLSDEIRWEDEGTGGCIGTHYIKEAVKKLKEEFEQEVSNEFFTPDYIQKMIDKIFGEKLI